jgi:PST family polysaccharide transporter
VVAAELIRVVLGPRWLEAILPFRVLAVGHPLPNQLQDERLPFPIHGSGVPASSPAARVCRAGDRRGLLGAPLGDHRGGGGCPLALTVHFLLMAQLSLEVCRMSWSTFWAAHLPGALLGVAAGSVAWAVATGLRQLLASPLMILVVSAGVALASVVWLMRRFPRQCLGGGRRLDPRRPDELCGGDRVALDQCQAGRRGGMRGRPGSLPSFR